MKDYCMPELRIIVMGQNTDVLGLSAGDGSEHAFDIGNIFGGGNE